MDFHQPDRHYCRSSSSTFQLTLSLHRRLTYKRSSTLQTNFSDNIMSSNYAISRVHSKSKKVRFDPSSEIHLYRHGNSEALQYCQSTTRPNGISTHDNLTIPNSDSSLGPTFLSLLGKVSAAADFMVSGCLHLCLLQMCLLSVWRPHILTLDHPISITNLIGFHLKWWTDPNQFIQGTHNHPPDPTSFLFLPSLMIVAGYYGFTLDISVSVRPSISRMSVCPYFVSRR